MDGQSMIKAVPKQSSKNVTSYPDMDFLRLRNSFFRILEELRMRRSKDVENEAKIGDLMKSEHKYLERIEELSQKYTFLEKSIVEGKKAIVEKFYEKRKNLEEEKANLETLCAVKEKKLKSLTDEIRSLQMNKHTLENKVREKESIISTHNDSREVCMKQLQQLQQECASVATQVDQVLEQLELLRGNVTQSIDLNNKLSLVNSHQNCLMDELKQQLGKVTEELLQAKSTTHSAATTFSNGSCTLMNGDAQEPVHILELDDLLQQKLDSLQQEHKATLLSLKEAHQLISKHINSCNVAVASKNLLEERVNELSESNEINKTKLLQTQSQLQQLQEHQEMELVEQKNKVQDLLQRLVTLQTDFTNLQSSHDSLEGKLKEVTEEKSNLEGKLSNYTKENEKLQQVNSLLVANSLKKNEEQSLEQDQVVDDESSSCRGSSRTSGHISDTGDSPKALGSNNNSECVIDVLEMSREIAEMVVEAAVVYKEEEEGGGGGGTGGAGDVNNEELLLKKNLSQGSEQVLMVGVDRQPLLQEVQHSVAEDCIHDNNRINIDPVNNNSPINSNHSNSCINAGDGRCHPIPLEENIDPSNDTAVINYNTNLYPLMNDKSTNSDVDNEPHSHHSESSCAQDQSLVSVATSPPPHTVVADHSVCVPPYQQLIFSDDDDDDMELQDEESMRSINRVQSYLNRDRLKRPRYNQI